MKDLWDDAINEAINKADPDENDWVQGCVVFGIVLAVLTATLGCYVGLVLLMGGG